MSKKLQKIVKTLWYNSSLEIIDSLNKSVEDEKNKKFIGTSKKGKEWDSLKNRESEQKKRQFATPVVINKLTLEYMATNISEGKYPVISDNKKSLIRKLTSKEWNCDGDIKKELKNKEINIENIISYIKYAAFITASIAYEKNSKYTLTKEVIQTIDKIM